MGTETVCVLAFIQVLFGSWFISRRHPEILHNNDDPACGFGVIVLFFWEFFWLCDILVGKLRHPEHHT
jgi:hypothetical protein